MVFNFFKRPFTSFADLSHYGRILTDGNYVIESGNYNGADFKVTSKKDGSVFYTNSKEVKPTDFERNIESISQAIAEGDSKAFGEAIKGAAEPLTSYIVGEATASDKVKLAKDAIDRDEDILLATEILPRVGHNIVGEDGDRWIVALQVLLQYAAKKGKVNSLIRIIQSDTYPLRNDDLQKAYDAVIESGKDEKGHRYVKSILSGLLKIHKK